MSAHSKTFYIPPDTSPDEPVRIEFVMQEKIITRLDIMTDTVASKGLVGIRVIIGDGRFNIFHFPQSPGEWIRKSETWMGEFNVGQNLQPVVILGCSRLFYNDRWIGAEREHWASVTVHTR